MDLVTQSLLGGVVAQAVANKEEKAKATIIGLVAGLVADADVLIKSSSDPLLTIEYHRHFTHSLVFIPFGAAIAMLLLLPFMHRHFSLHRLYVLCLAGFSLSGLVDACTSYGTHLFWPFTDERTSFHIISIVDPIFTSILLLALLFELRIQYRTAACTGLFFCAVYLAFGYSQLQQATVIADRTISLRGHKAEQHVVKPTFGNVVLWRSVYIHDNQIYTDAIRLGLFSDDQLIEGESVRLFDVARDLPDLEPSSILYRDIERFRKFSENFIAVDPSQENVIGDIRYSLLPVTVKPLWGIVIDPSQPDQHVDYQFYRDLDQKTKQIFMDLLLGR